MMDALTVMEGVTFVVTVAMFLTGISPCRDMYVTGSTKNVPYLMFLLSTVSCFSMLHYGFILGLTTLVVLNILGTLLNATYCLIYMMVVTDKRESVTYLSLAVAFSAALYGYLYTVLEDEATRAPLLGATGSGITTLLMALPAIELVGNVRNHNSDGLPLVMIWGSIACCISWLIYGLMLDDINVYLPNIPGLVVSVGKIIVIHKYGGQEAEKKTQ